uniref:Uncharacterized protein n=1 Tax=Caenorhabditis japonica TaxID=281687 RepID=A0A8R1HSB4_CAEJA
MRIFCLSIILVASSQAFYVATQNGTDQDIFMATMENASAAELRSKKNSIELFGRQFDVPSWMTMAADKTRELVDSATGLFGKGGAPTSRKSTDGLVTNLKSNESTRIMFAVYLNVLAIILIYVFIAIKLALLSISEGQQERKKRNHFSSHVAFDAPDYNLPLASIATRSVRAPMSIDNPAADFEMAREASEEEVIRRVEPLDFDAIPSTERDDSF